MFALLLRGQLGGPAAWSLVAGPLVVQLSPGPGGRSWSSSIIVSVLDGSHDVHVGPVVGTEGRRGKDDTVGVVMEVTTMIWDAPTAIVTLETPGKAPSAKIVAASKMSSESPSAAPITSSAHAPALLEPAPADPDLSSALIST